MIFSSGTLPTTSNGRFVPEAAKSTILSEKCSGSRKIAENQCLFSRIVYWNASEHDPKSRFFRKTPMGTLEKSSKSHEIWTSRGRFAKTDDFQLRDGSDSVQGTIRTGSRKIDDFERKMLRIAKNRGKSIHFFANRLL